MARFSIGPDRKLRDSRFYNPRLCNALVPTIFMKRVRLWASTPSAPARKCPGRLGLALRDKQLAPAARADVALNEFARVRRLEIGKSHGAPCTLAAFGLPVASNQGRPVGGRSHAMITSCGVRRLRRRLCLWVAAFAKASACRPDCRFSRASATHSRIMARRTFGLAIWIAF